MPAANDHDAELRVANSVLQHFAVVALDMEGYMKVSQSNSDMILQELSILTMFTPFNIAAVHEWNANKV